MSSGSRFPGFPGPRTCNAGKPHNGQKSLPHYYLRRTTAKGYQDLVVSSICGKLRRRSAPIAEPARSHSLVEEGGRLQARPQWTRTITVGRWQERR